MPRKTVTKAGTMKDHEGESKRNKNEGNANANPVQHGKRKFQRRIIESNWAKYDLDENSDVESEQDKSSSGANFETLVLQSGKNVSSFQFKGEENIEPENKDDFQQAYHEERKGALGFDLGKTSSYLQNVPIFIKLGLQNMLDTLDDKVSEWHGDYFNQLKNHTEILQHDTGRGETDGIADLKWIFNDNEIYEKRVRLLMKRLEDVNRTNARADEKDELRSGTTNQNEKVMMSHSKNDSQDENYREFIKRNKDLETIEDDGLESLMKIKSLTVEENTTLPDLGPFLVSESCTSNEDQNKTIGDNFDKIEKEIIDTPEECGERDNESLEDWLDSILD